jgi:hypothetical protein
MAVSLLGATICATVLFGCDDEPTDKAAAKEHTEDVDDDRTARKTESADAPATTGEVKVTPLEGGIPRATALKKAALEAGWTVNNEKVHRVGKVKSHNLTLVRSGNLAIVQVAEHDAEALAKNAEAVHKRNDISARREGAIVISVNNLPLDEGEALLDELIP